MIDKISSIESRLKTIEDKTNQESRFASIETTFTQLRSENTELQLTIQRLKSDIESLQFVTVQLCTLDVKLKESEDCCSCLIVQNKDLKSNVSGLRKEVSDLRSDVKLLNSHKETRELASANGISLEQQVINSNVVVRGIEVSEDSNQSELLDIYKKISTHLGVSDTNELAAVSAKVLSTKRSNTDSKKIQHPP